MPMVPVNGIDLYYEEAGKGEPLVLIPGMGGTVESWMAQTAHFQSMYRVISLDNRGSGRSSKPAGPYTMDQMAADLAGLLDALDITQPVNLAGASLGGVMAQCFIHNYPERVKRLILVCTGVSSGDPHITFPGMSVWTKLINPGRTDEERLRTLFSIFYHPSYLKAHPEIIDASLKFMEKIGPQPLHASTAQLRAVQDMRPYYKWLAEIAVPILIMHGEDDLIWPVKNAHTLHKGTGGTAQLAIFPNVGHVPFQEIPGEFNARLEEFLRTT